MFYRLITLAISICLSGCASVVHVYDKGRAANSNSEKLNGIPFYVKVQRYIKTSTYRATWLRSTLTVETKLVDTTTGREVLISAGSQNFVKNSSKPASPELNEIRLALIAADRSTDKNVRDVIKRFNHLPEFDADNPNAPVLVSNLIDSIWIVDDENTFYLNAPLPWFGTGNLTQKLSSEGTLLEVSSTADTKMADGLSTLIPFKEFLTGRFVEPAETAVEDDDEIEALIAPALAVFRKEDPKTTTSNKLLVYSMSLSIDEVGYELNLKSLPSKDLPTIVPLEFSDVSKKQALFTRVEIGDVSSDKKEKDAGPHLDISGRITLPIQEPVVEKNK